MAARPEIQGLSHWRALARGGFATVWVAQQDSLNRPVAVKVDQRTLETESEQRRFLREAGAAGRMSGHPGIVTVHDAGILADERPFLVMELCPGGSLTSWLKPENRPSQQRVRDLGVRIADALAAAHVRGVLHRDVKPANILIDAFDNPGLADFGLAIIPEPEADLSEALEALTPAYAAPEVLDREPATEFGDVYSLAATLYALLAGRPPRPSESEVTTRVQVVALHNQPILPLPHVAPEFMALLMDALADDPHTRPTAAGFRDRLQALFLPGDVEEGVTSTQAQSPDAQSPDAELLGAPVPEQRRRTRATFAVIAVLAAVVVLAIVMALVRFNTPTVAGPGPSVVPTPSATLTGTTPTSASPTPTHSSTPVDVPAGFTDCSLLLGKGLLCRTNPECWGGIFSYADSPYQATPTSCEKLHVYQTFGAVQLSTSPRRQSKINANKAVQSICNRKTLNKMLVGTVATRAWEVYAIPPQFGSDTVYRCIFGRGERTIPFILRPPA